MFMLYLHHACYIILLDFILMDMKGNTYNGRQNWRRCDFTKSTSPILQIPKNMSPAFHETAWNVDTQVFFSKKIKLIYATNQQPIAYLNSRKGIKWFYFIFFFIFFI